MKSLNNKLSKSEQQPIGGMLLKPENRRDLETFLTSTIQNNPNQALSAWRRIFPTKTDRTIADAEAKILNTKANAQCKLIELMGKALIDEFELCQQWKQRVLEERLKHESGTEMMRIRMEAFQQNNRYFKAIQEDFGKQMFALLDDFRDACERLKSYPQPEAELVTNELKKNLEQQIRALGVFMERIADHREEYS
ncbi:MAG: hypothetical protein AB4206_09005 [Xenococcaceae cyanobacterium]